VSNKHSKFGDLVWLTDISALAALEDAGDVSSPPPAADDNAANAEAKASE
jgi:hypothetical protein